MVCHGTGMGSMLILFGTLYSQLYNALWAAAGVGTLVVIIGTVYGLVMGNPNCIAF